MLEKIKDYEIALALIMKAKETYMSRLNGVLGMCQAFILAIRENPEIMNSVSNLIIKEFGLAKLEEFKKAGAGFGTNAWIRCIISEFNFFYLCGDISFLLDHLKEQGIHKSQIEEYPEVVDGMYWWPKDDCLSRMRAFDSLIHLYRSKIDRLFGL